MHRTFLLLVVVAMSLVVGPVPPLFAETYEWVDSQGTSHFTDDLTKVPPSQRDKVRILSLPEPSSSPPSAASHPASPSGSQSVNQTDSLPPEGGAPAVQDAYGKCREELRVSRERLDKQLAQDQARLEELNRLIHRTATSRQKNELQRERVRVKERILEAQRAQQQDLPRMEWECERKRGP